MNKPNAERMEFVSLHIEKLSPEGKLETFLTDDKIYMRLVETKGPRQGVWILENTDGQQDQAQRYQTRFIDFCSEAESVISTLDRMDERPTLATFQHMV